MNVQKPICPHCGQNDRVEKVSTIYMEGIGAGRLPGMLSSSRSVRTVQPGRLTAIPINELKTLSQKLAPPSAGKSEVTRPIHPDLVVLAFSAILPVFLAGIVNSQRGLLIPVLLLVVGFYAVYIWRRKSLIESFENIRSARQEEVHQIEQAIGRWMNVYYCARDGGVFEPDKSGWVPAEKMIELLRLS